MLILILHLIIISILFFDCIDCFEQHQVRIGMHMSMYRHMWMAIFVWFFRFDFDPLDVGWIVASMQDWVDCLWIVLFIPWHRIALKSYRCWGWWGSRLYGAPIFIVERLDSSSRAEVPMARTNYCTIVHMSRIRWWNSCEAIRNRRHASHRWERGKEKERVISLSWAVSLLGPDEFVLPCDKDHALCFAFASCIVDDMSWRVYRIKEDMSM